MPQDRFGWYLYLAETFLDDGHSYEPIQGARVIPIFAQLGANFDLLQRIGGVRDKCLKIVSGECVNTDGGLFEILVALMYARDGWQTVNLVPHSPLAKTPDIRVESASAEWFASNDPITRVPPLSNRVRAKSAESAGCGPRSETRTSTLKAPQDGQS